MEKTEFHYVFQITKLVLFEVDYYTLSTNKHPYFATSARRYVRSKMAVDTCGQCQDTVLFGPARAFWKKWDAKHLQDLAKPEYDELLEDIERLKETYEYDVEMRDTFAGTHWSFPQNRMKQLSMRPLKKKSAAKGHSAKGE